MFANVLVKLRNWKDSARKLTLGRQKCGVTGVKPMRIVLRAIGLCFWMLVSVGLAGQAMARQSVDVALRCDVAADAAARETGVPAAVLMAIARVETGRTIGGALAPWPWTVNEAGAGNWFDSADAALDHVAKAVAAGGTNIDIGCFQINLRWHGEAFHSIDAMFDPHKNALYAARFLQTLHDEFGSWDGAVGAYHSRKAEAAEGYLAKVAAVLDAPLPLGTAPPDRMAEGEAAPRDNRYPLLQGGAGGGNGSLVSGQASGALPLLR